MNEPEIVLVRSARELINQNQIGYGWENINFSIYSSDEDLIEDGFKKQGYNLGRKTKQIKRYFNLKKDDIVIVPVSGAIAIGIVKGLKTYHKTPVEGYSNNRIDVKYLSSNDGNMFIPRKSLTTALQSRLKIRMTIAILNEFKDEIKKHITSLNKGELHTWAKEVEKKESDAVDLFKKELLIRLQNGKKIGLSSGGYGLEKLVKELLEIQGYQARISAKNASSGIDDIDVIATKTNELTSDVEGLFLQVKHHNGNTNNWGIEQLKAYDISNDDYAFYRKILITTGELSDIDKKLAHDNNIIVIEGIILVDWIYDNIEKLDISTKISLGITNRPSLI
jgi:restriction system protein